jgi:hypothetical protein
MKVTITHTEEESHESINVELDSADTWSLDYTLALIIHPCLVQLKKTKLGSPFVDNLDVWDESLWATQEELKHYDKTGETDKNFHNRWDHVLDEMIWAFGQYMESDAYPPIFYKDSGDIDWESTRRMERGLRLFGKYYMNLWD